jgi:hypothetical protein
MAFPTSAGSPGTGGVAPNVAYSGTFIPEIWSGKLIEKFYDATVLAAIANTDYAGEITNQGDKVIIRTKPTISINDYAADQSLTVERPSSNIVELLIDEGKYFATILDDVMEVQADLNQLGMWADDASEQMKIAIDTDVLLGLLGQADAANQGATAGRLSGTIDLGATTTPLNLVSRAPVAGETEVVDMILRAGQALDEQNIPETGRWALCPPWMATMIKQSELRDASLTNDGVSMLRNGRLGMIDRFTLYSTNLMPVGAITGLAAGESAIYAGHSHGLTFASQLTKMETLRAETTFGTIMRGLQVYGYKVTDGTAIVQMVAQPSVL